MVEYVFPKLATKATSSILHNFERTTNEQRAIRAGKRFTLFISNYFMDNINKIVKLLQDSGLLIDGDTETLKHEIKNKKLDFLVL